MHAFKVIINDLKNYYEKAKIFWLLKNLIEYKKYQIKNETIKKRKINYNFENIYILLKKEGYEDNIINKMKEIINEVKNRNRDDYKKKIFDFIIESVDYFKTKQEEFLSELNIILKQVKLDFKEMVKQKVGNTQDVQNFMKKENCSFYWENNYQNNKHVVKRDEQKENNIINKEKKINYIDTNQKENKITNEYNLYNGFKIKSYEPEYK